MYKSPRNYGFDNLKSFLTILVVFHHAAQAYTPGSGWLLHDAFQTRGLIPLLTVDASFFMGLFFFISGNFIPASLAKHGPGKFSVDKLKRLLVPALVIAVAIPPFALYIRSPAAVTLEALIDFYRREFIVGHGWFLVQLLAYALCFVAMRPILQKAWINFNAVWTMTLVGLVLGGITQLVALHHPINQWFFFDIIEPYHLPQYILMFVLGCLYGQQRQPIQGRSMDLYLILSTLLVGVYLLNFHHSFGLAKVEALWSSLLGVFLILGLTGFFQRFLNYGNALLKLMASHAFGIYVVHIFVVLMLQKMLLPLDLGAGFKFALTGVFAYLISLAMVMVYDFLLPKTSRGV